MDRIKNKEVWFCSIPWVMAFTDEMGVYSQCNFGQVIRKHYTGHIYSRMDDWFRYGEYSH